MTQKDYENKITQHYFYVLNIKARPHLSLARKTEAQGVLKNGFYS